MSEPVSRIRRSALQIAMGTPPPDDDDGVVDAPAEAVPEPLIVAVAPALPDPEPMIEALEVAAEEEEEAPIVEEVAAPQPTPEPEPEHEPAPPVGAPSLAPPQVVAPTTAREPLNNRLTTGMKNRVRAHCVRTGEAQQALLARGLDFVLAVSEQDAAGIPPAPGRDPRLEPREGPLIGAYEPFNNRVSLELANRVKAHMDRTGESRQNLVMRCLEFLLDASEQKP